MTLTEANKALHEEKLEKELIELEQRRSRLQLLIKEKSEDLSATNRDIRRIERNLNRLIYGR